MDSMLIEDICKILGVYLDNAIEATENILDKEIIISLYKDKGSIVIEISNTFLGEVDLNKINNIGYTTKVGNHGYGLPLCNEIINKNEKLNGKTIVNTNVFKQSLVIAL